MAFDDSDEYFQFLAQIDAICDRYEQSRRNGEDVSIEQTVQESAYADSELLFENLLMVELELLRGWGQTPTAASFLTRFPQYAPVVQRAFRPGNTVEATRRRRRQSYLQQWPRKGDFIAEFELLDDGREGSIARVYRALQTSVDRQVALKISRYQSNEPQSLARLDHPGIVRIHDRRLVGEFDVVVMEFVDGQSLQELIAAWRQRGIFDDRFQQVCDLGIQLADALQHAHEQGINHLDIKPSNIILTRLGRTKLLDFNASQMAHADLPPLVGTPPYSSPEQELARTEQDDELQDQKRIQLDARSDIYSLGFVLWELATGERPTSVAARLEAEGSSVTDSLSGMPPGLERTLKKCLQRDLKLRLASAAALADELKLCGSVTLQERLFPPRRSFGAFLSQQYVPVILLVFLGFAGNALVSAISIPWNRQIAESVEADKKFFTMAVWVNACMYLVGTLACLRSGMPVLKALYAFHNRVHVTVDSTLASRCARLGHEVGKRSMLLWAISSLVWFAWGWFELKLSLSYLLLFSLSVLFFGTIAGPLVFFPITWVCLRIYQPQFEIRSQGHKRIDLEHYLIGYAVAFPMGVLIVLLCVLLISYEMQAMMHVDIMLFVPFLIVLILLLIVGVGLGILVDRRIRAEIKVLARMALSSGLKRADWSRIGRIYFVTFARFEVGMEL